MRETQEYEYDFRPVEGDEIRAYHIADAHNRIDGPVAAANKAGEHDLLILNGDIPNHSGDIKYFAAIHCIAGEITKGQYPVIFSRGNHDMRGIYAENIQDHTPTDNGRSYYSVRIGSLWALVLDCGEDKPDGNDEYGHTICCADFRRRQTEYIEKIISRIILLGALLLSVVALFPNVITLFTNLIGAPMTLSLGGTSLIIVVGVALETVKQLESQMMMRHYKGFLD